MCQVNTRAQNKECVHALPGDDETEYNTIFYILIKVELSPGLKVVPQRARGPKGWGKEGGQRENLAL